MHCSVIHIRDARNTASEIYIGRESKTRKRSEWANPFFIGKDGTREEVLEKYEAYAWEMLESGHWEEEDLLNLIGYTLVCYCAPERCHGNVLDSMITKILARREEQGY